MKKISIAVMCVILAVLTGLLAYAYINKYKPMLEAKPSQEEIYVPGGTGEAKRGEKSLLSESTDGFFKLYKAGDFCIIEYKGYEEEFSDWSKNIGREKPDIYCSDFNGDGESEYVIRALKEFDAETKDKVYCLYAVFINKAESGSTQSFTVKLVDRGDWSEMFTKTIKIELSQPEGAKNRIQIAMNTQNETISYNSETGIMTDGHGWYARALYDGAGNYYTFSGWEKGAGIITIDEKARLIDVEVPVYVKYSEVQKKETVGVIKCGLVVSRDRVSIRSKSLLFEPNDSCVATDPSDAEEKPWTASLKNTMSPRAKTNKIIEKLSVDCSDVALGKTVSTEFSVGKDDASLVEKIDFDNNTIKLYARSGYEFSKAKTASRNYSAEFTNDKNQVCDISFSASVMNENGVSVLVYKLDRSYSAQELKFVQIKLGV